MLHGVNSIYILPLVKRGLLSLFSEVAEWLKALD
jgi:hypothetical protein